MTMNFLRIECLLINMEGIAEIPNPPLMQKLLNGSLMKNKIFRVSLPTNYLLITKWKIVTLQWGDLSGTHDLSQGEGPINSHKSHQQYHPSSITKTRIQQQSIPQHGIFQIYFNFSHWHVFNSWNSFLPKGISHLWKPPDTEDPASRPPAPWSYPCSQLQVPTWPPDLGL